jgi:hypothetical protein
MQHLAGIHFAQSAGIRLSGSLLTFAALLAAFPLRDEALLLRGSMIFILQEPELVTKAFLTSACCSSIIIPIDAVNQPIAIRKSV